MKTEYDLTKNMLKTIRTLTESKSFNKSIINEQSQEQRNSNDQDIYKDMTNSQPSNDVDDDIMVINDVEVKLLSSDQADMSMNDQQKQVISTLIDGFRQQVSQIVEFEPGLTINMNQIRLDGTLTNEDISFVFIAGEENGVYINADMLKLEQNVADALEKLVKFEQTFISSMEPLITQRSNN
jgi:hypothetical protein